MFDAGRLSASFELPASGALVIGRGVDVQLSLPHPSVSRRHACLEVRGVGERLIVRLQDLGSANGTSFRGRRLGVEESVELVAGESFEVGSVVAVLQRGTPSELERVAPTGVVPAGRVVVDPAVRDLYRLVSRVAPSDLNVLLLGETGVGKEVFAEAIHTASLRAAGPLVRVNCAALSESLLESELFGHERGAFTGAHQRRVGLLESAAGGTVFLDEIGELSGAMQGKLLRVLEQRELTRLGGVESIRLDVRFVSATNRALTHEVSAERFRRDLYFRLNGLSLHIPPLRARRAELLPLARRFVEQAALAQARPAPRLSHEAVARLEAHDWPGNLRELRQTIERAVLIADGPEIGADDLRIEELPTPAQAPGRERAPSGASSVASSVSADAAALGESAATRVPSRTLSPRAPTLPPEAIGAEPPPLDAPQDEEHRAVLAALDACAGNQTRAAKMLGVSRTTLVARLRRYEIPRPRK